MRSAIRNEGSSRNGAGSQDLGAQALEDKLREDGVRGEVRFDRGSRALYATDYSIYRQVPIGVVIPKDNEDVVKTVAACHQHGQPAAPLMRARILDQKWARFDRQSFIT